MLGSTDMILPEDLPEQTREGAHLDPVAAGMYEQAVEAAKRETILKAFERSGNNHEAAARLLGLHPNYLHRLIKAMDLKSTLPKRLGRG